MKNKKGFTLVEILAVIIILGIIMVIAIPAVSRYILKSNKSVYASNISAYVESARTKYEMKEYGAYLKDDEIMIVPIRTLVLEKGNEESSPYGEYDFDKSYIVVVPEYQKYNMYVTIIDETKTGLVGVMENTIEDTSIKEDITDEITTISSLEAPGAIYSINNQEYKKIESREIEGDDVNRDEDAKVYVFKNINIPEDPTGMVYKVTLNNKGATTAGTETIYELYSVGWYLDSSVTSKIVKITPPYKNGYAFLGYYTEDNGAGVQIVNTTGYIVAGKERTFTSEGTIYAKWQECQNGYYSNNSVTCTICPAGYRDGTNLSNKTSESACLKNVPAGKFVGTAGAENTQLCAANKYLNSHTVTYGNTSTCKSCTKLGSNYTKSTGGTGENGCYMTVEAGKYKTAPKGNDKATCEGNTVSSIHNSYYNQSDNPCTPCQQGYEPNGDHSTCIVSDVTCGPGYYLVPGSRTCTECLANNYCPGGTFHVNTGGGITACNSGFSSSAGSSSKTQCCKKTKKESCEGTIINKKCYTSYTNSGWANTCGNWDCTYGDSGGCCAGCVIGSNKSNCRNPDRCDCRYPLALTVTYDETCQS